MKLSYQPGATPLDPDEIEDLIPSIFTQGELNKFEKENIRSAMNWTRKSRKIKKDLLSVSGLSSLHKEMFKDVWKWAGKFRKSEKNIGVLAHHIQSELYNLCEDVKLWTINNTYHWDEIGVRFHHRLVAIHAFANGNGRHARIAADLLLQFNKKEIFTWGSSEISVEGEARKKYLAALKKADKYEYADLILFARQ